MLPTDGPGVPIGERRKLKPFLEVAGPIGGRVATAFEADAPPNHDAANSHKAKVVSRVDLIFVMRKAHRSKLQLQIRAALAGKRANCLT